MYCSVNEMAKRFGQKELDKLARADDNSFDATQVEQAITDATDRIDGYLASRYTLPFISVPTVLNRLCADMSRYFLYDSNAPEQIKTRYDEAISFLKSVSTGQASLGLTDDNSTPESNDLAEIQSAGTLFGRADSKGFI
ncbi:phage protein Gp36 family protein [Psychromonas sp. MME2]|uniref:gp436 family protein n=1 Tax=unclassified Psychromonas TaxID=2614957 RepID=UPI00339CF5D5